MFEPGEVEWLNTIHLYIQYIHALNQTQASITDPHRYQSQISYYSKGVATRHLGLELALLKTT